MKGQQIQEALPSVALDRVSKHFPGVLANDRVSLSLYPGEVHVLLGENGAGKSTLISLLAGVHQPDGGRILIDGQEVRIRSPRHALAHGIGTVFQHSTLVPSLTLLENLMLGTPWWRKLDRQAALSRFQEILERLDITLEPHTPLGTLSLGEQQLVEFVKALWLGQRLLILDEATSMLSAKGIERLHRVVAHLKSEGTSILFVTHKLSEALEFGDRLSILRAGCLVGSLSTSELHGLDRKQASERIVAMMFGERPQAAPACRAALAPEARIVLRVESLRVASRPLEQKLEAISFFLKAGEILGIAGLEGSGQKQLAEALAGQRRCLSGIIELDGQAIQSLDVGERQGLGLRYLSDDRLGEATVGTFSIAHNLLLKRIGQPPFWHHGFERSSAIQDHARTRIEEFDVRAPGPSTAIARLSGGNIQKVLLARELDGHPKVVIYNKPTHGLDLKSSDFARRAIVDQAARGTAGILISTELDELLELCDRIAVMSRGRLLGVVEKNGEARERIGALMIGSGSPQ